MPLSGYRLKLAIEYLKREGIVRSQKEVAEKMETTPPNVSSAVNGVETVLTKSFLQRFNRAFNYQFNEGWLIDGEGDMLTSNATTNDVFGVIDYETYLLPQSAMGGSLSGFAEDGVTLQNCEKVISPIKGIDFAISIYGDSMTPEYPSGSRVLIKKIDPSVFIDWGKVYVLDTSNGVIIKELHKNEKEGYVTCHSINPDPKYADFELAIADVYGFYRVLMCLSAK